VLREAFQTKDHGVDVRSGLAGAAAAIGPLAIGIAAGHEIAGVVAAIGGLNAALCVPRAGIGARAGLAALCVVGGGITVALADVATSDAALILVTLVWVGVWGLFRAAGPAGALLGFAVGAMLVIYAGLPITGSLDRRLLWYALGAVPGAVVMILARGGQGASFPTWAEIRRKVGEHPLLWHVVRLSVAVAAGTLLYRVAGLNHGYWVPLTILAGLQPTSRSTRIRSLQRAAGTLVAAAVVVVVTLATDQSWPLVVCGAVAAFFLYAVRERGYFWLVVLLTPTALFMLSAVDFQGDTVAFDRISDSMIGIMIGLLFGELAGLAARL